MIEYGRVAGSYGVRGWLRVVVDEPDHVEVECADCRHYVGHGITGTEGMTVSVAIRPEKIKLQRAEIGRAHV